MFNFLKWMMAQQRVSQPTNSQLRSGGRGPGSLATAFILPGVVAMLLAACQAAEPGASIPTTAPLVVPPAVTMAVSQVTEEITSTLTTSVSAPVEMAAGMTNARPDGNRVVSGRGDLPALAPMDIPLNGTPVWVVAAPTSSGALWVATLDDGSVQAFEVADGAATAAPITPAQLPAGMPPLLVVEDDAARLVVPDNASPFTSPARFGRNGLAFIDRAGNLVVEQSGETSILPVDALPDARILVDERGRLLLLTAPTGRYGHGVLGDALEAGAITLVETSPTPRIVQTITIPAPRVVEGVAPIWADLDGDGVREIIVTLSDGEQGAQIVVYDEGGRQSAAGPAIGRGSRWRHQLAVAPFGPGSETELVSVFTPHIGGVVEFYRLQGDELVIDATQGGYTSHVMTTRNLDMAVAGDFDGDGQAELLLPDQARGLLGAVRHDADGATVAWTLPVDGQVTTNLAAVTLADGGLAAGVGRTDGVLRIWQP